MFLLDVVRNRFAVIAAWIMVVIWMSAIFFLSSQPAAQSNELSEKVTEILVLVLGRMNFLSIEASTISDTVAQLNTIIRNYAHGAEFFILALLAANAFNKSGSRGTEEFALTIGLCSIYALTDEIHQIFVPGRACEYTDYTIDLVGIIVGYGAYSIFHGTYCQWGNKKS